MARVEGVVEWRLHLDVAKRYRAPAAPFARKYTASNIELLVEMDRANEDVCGPAIGHLFKRAYNTYGDKRYERLVKLSVSHHVQPAHKQRLPSHACHPDQDPPGVQPNRFEQGTTTQWACWLGAY